MKLTNCTLRLSILLLFIIGLTEAIAQTTNLRLYVTMNGKGDGSSWSKSTANLQGAINTLNEKIKNKQITTGEVWVAAGKYKPTELISDLGDMQQASFIIYEGITLYGGFYGNETKLDQRAKSTNPNTSLFEWSFVNETILTGDLDKTEAVFYYNPLKGEYDTKFVKNAYHVLWFATNGFDGDRAKALTNKAVVDGFTITHGNASESGSLSHLSKGGGAYMVKGSLLRNCIVKQNQSSYYGGGVYADGGGEIVDCLITENQCTGQGLSFGYGGGVMLHDNGSVVSSFIHNNISRNGGGLTFYNSSAEIDVAGMVGVNCIIANNSATNEGGGIYMYRGGVSNQNTIVRNYCSSVGTLFQGQLTGRTGGVYIHGGGVLANSVCWSNDAVTQSVQYHFYKSSNSNAMVYNSAFSSNDIINWEGTDNQETFSLAETNTGSTSELYPAFTTVPVADAGICLATLPGRTPVEVYFDNYNWKPEGNSALREKGMSLSEANKLLPAKSVLNYDMLGRLHKIKSELGALNSNTISVKPTNNNIYVDPDRENISSSAGESWDNPVSSLNDALIYCKEHPLTGNYRYSIHVKEGVVYTYGQYLTSDVRSACIYIPNGVEILGGYSAIDPSQRNLMLYRTIITGEIGAVGDYNDNAYHCIVTADNAQNIIIDGVHVVSGNTENGNSQKPFGAGVLLGTNSYVTLRNSIVENCTAQYGSAIYVPSGARIDISNTILNNNTSISSTQSSTLGIDVSAAPGSRVSGSSIIRNLGVGVRNAGSTIEIDNCWVWSNQVATDYIPFSGSLKTTYCAVDLGVSLIGKGNIATLSHNHADNSQYTYPLCVNETKSIGANPNGYDTYYGGFANWTPTNMNPIVNAGSLPVTATDLTQKTRNYGGAPDIGALENDALPESGTVAYVRADGNDSNSGLSWSKAKKTISAAQSISGVKDIWVAAGVYTGNFILALDKNVYGGFLAVGNPGMTAEERDISHEKEEFKTILQAKDKSHEYSVSDNIKDRVLEQTATSYNSVTTWEGFVIQNGFLKDNTATVQGGAGVLLKRGGRVKNCLIQDCIMISDAVAEEHSKLYGGAAIYCEGGLIENSIIKKNYLSTEKSINVGSFFNPKYIAYLSGAALFMKGGKVTNCVIAQNQVATSATVSIIMTRYPEYKHSTEISNILGGAVFCAAESTFFNCTLAYNICAASVAVVPGVWDNSKTSKMVNCILWGNAGYSKTKENLFQFGVSGQQANSNLLYCYTSATNFKLGNQFFNNISGGATVSTFRPANHYETILSTSTLVLSNSSNNYGPMNRFLVECIRKQPFEGSVTIDNISIPDNRIVDLDLESITYKLKSNAAKCINTGFQAAVEGISNLDIPTYQLGQETSNGYQIVDAPLIEVDAAGYLRTQNCSVDKGAYEYDGDLDISGTNEMENSITWHTYYVTQNGAGDAKANSIANAACAEKLQEVLDAAGRYKKVNPTANVRIKIAKHTYTPTRKEVKSFTSLAWSDDERTYSFFIPRGVTLLGGYDANFKERNPITNPTVLSGNRLNASSVEQYMYHVVSFTQRDFTAGAWSQTETLLSGITQIDGIYLKNGNASGQLSGQQDGGGAIVPQYVHLRNCIVQNCYAANQGGGLYLLPGATVSGSLITYNQAKYGAGVSVAPLSGGLSEPAKLLTSTIINNTTYTGGRGGGLHFGESNAYINSCVIWRNNANTGKNVYGVTDKQVTLEIEGIKDANGKTRTLHYPFNYSAVGGIRQPGENNLLLQVDNDKGVHYSNCDLIANPQLKEYAKPTVGSVLINSGMPVNIWEQIKSQFDLEQFDYANEERGKSNVNLDMGARISRIIIYKSGDPIFTRLFVTDGNHAISSDKRYGKCGTSFHNPFTSLDEALNYIEMVRAHSTTDEDKSKRFEIFMAAGSYYPFSAPGGYSMNWRKNSFAVPQGVSIYGGFDGSYNGVDWEYYQPASYDTGIDEGQTGTIPTNAIATEEALMNREMTDINRNGILEPWELRRQTIINGKVNSNANEPDAYHLIYNAPASSMGYTAYKGTDKTILIDGIYLINGEGLHRSDAVDVDRDNHSYYKGGAVYVGDASTPLSIRRCQFVDNQSRRGGAIYSNGALYTYGCFFAQNRTLVEASTPNIGLKDGWGSVVFMEDAPFYTFNSIFANNEADGSATLYGGAKGLYSMNSNIVRNKAASFPAFYFDGVHSNTKDDNLHINSLFWGNESITDNVIQNGLPSSDLASAYKRVLFSAYEEKKGPIAEYNVEKDERLSNAVSSTGLTANNNLFLDSENGSLNGPRFNNPSTIAGVDGYDIGHSWAINGQSILLDAGWGKLDQKFDANDVPYFTGTGCGGYYNIAANAQGVSFKDNIWKWLPYLTTDIYMKRSSGTPLLRVSTNPNVNHEYTFIDIGVYEYPHVKLELKENTLIDTIYVRTHETPDVVADGSTWERATSDLQRALETLLASRNGRKKMIFIAEGEYAPTYLINGNRGFVINNNILSMAKGHDGTIYESYPINDIIIRGGYSDIAMDNHRRDYHTYKTVIKSMPNRGTKHLIYLEDMTYGTGEYMLNGKLMGRKYDGWNTHPTDIRDANGEVKYTIAHKSVKDEKSIIPIAFEGITFSNEYSDEEGAIFKTKDDLQGNLIINACEFALSGKQKGSKNAAVSVSGAKIFNSLFHSNYASPLRVNNSVIMNCTFANNEQPIAFGMKNEMYNSVLWGNKGNQTYENVTLEYNAMEGYTLTGEETNHFLLSDNRDLFNGPNFVNPKLANHLFDGYDYSLNPSLKLLDTGDSHSTGTENNASVGDGSYFHVMKTELNGGCTYDSNGEISNMRNLLDPAYRLRFITDKVMGELDAQFNDRFFASVSADKTIDRGAYEFDKKMRSVTYVDPSSAVSGDGSSWNSPLKGLQTAIDLAFVKANNSKEHAFILVKRGNFNEIVARRGVSVYASIQVSETEVVDDALTQFDAIKNSVIHIAAKRPGLVGENTARTVIKQLKTAGMEDNSQSVVHNHQFSFFDGFEISGTDSDQPVVDIRTTLYEAGQKRYNPFILRNSLIWNNTNSNLSTDIDKNALVYNKGGLLYNILLHSNATAASNSAHVVNDQEGFIANVTICADTLKQLINLGNSSLYNNMLCEINSNELNPYLVRSSGSNFHIAYQLDENAEAIDRGDSLKDVPGINYATDRDLLGNNRLYNEKVDAGCFETWRIPMGAVQHFTPLHNNYPHHGSVVYAMEGARLLLADDFIGKFQPTYLLLKNNAEFVGNGKEVEMNYLAVERKFTQGYHLLSLPFKVNADDEGSLQQGVIDADTKTPVRPLLFTYDGKARASALNKYHTANSPYWVPFNGEAMTANVGYLYQNTSSTDVCYRFTSNGGNKAVYSENDKSKLVDLQQYNNTQADNVQFTYKENMGWNLFGVPYLCRYDWTKVNVPHIIYGMNNSGDYHSFYSWQPAISGGAVATTTPMFSGYFTQTAIINGPEKLKFAAMTANDDLESITSSEGVKLQISKNTEESGDGVLLFASANPHEALSYNYGADAVKMMSSSDAPQIYISNATNNRFSIITSVDSEAATPVGVAVNTAGNYTISLSDNGADEYDYVMLTDAQTGKTVNLKEAGYGFSAHAASDMANRFALTFKKIDEVSHISPTAYAIDNGVRVENLSIGDELKLYDTHGRIIEQRTAVAVSESFIQPKGVYILSIIRNANEKWNLKLSIK